MKRYFLLFAALSFFNFPKILTAQTDLAIGRWKSHLPFNSGIYVTQSDDRVFYATHYAVLIIDKDDHALERLTKVEGLSRVGVSLVKYNKQSDVLVVVYTDGVIDLVDKNSIRTLLNIPGSNIILGEKKVYDIYMANDSIAYLSANFGITTLNLRSGLFPNTVKTPVEVRGVQIFEGKLFAATEEGIYTIDLASGLNVNDFSNWGLMAGVQGFPGDYSSKTIAVFNGKLYADVSDSLYVYDGDTAQYLHHEDNFNMKFLSAEGSHLLVGFRCNGECDGRVLIFDTDNSFEMAPADCINRPDYATEDAQGTIWYADDFNFFRVQGKGSGTCEGIQVNSPFSINIREIAVADDQVWIAAGGLDLQFSALFRIDGISSFIKGSWNVYNLGNQPALAGISDFYDILVNPNDGKVYAGAFLDALVVYDPATGEFQVYNETNSTLQFSMGDVMRTRVAGLALDEEGNLWVCNNNAPKPLSVLKPDGSWQSFDLPCTPENGILEIAIDDFGYKWLTTNNSSIGVIVFDQGDFDNLSDDRCKMVNTSNSVLPTNEVNTVEVDMDGGVWVGTKSGAVVFQCNPLDSECPGTRPFVEVDGFGANLLEDQDVRTIGVDGANRKWFGTGTGVFIQSPEGNEQVAHFTTENSPLFDNNIVDIAFNHSTGEAYIGTLKGLISYRSDATEGGATHTNDVLVFPNPVRPGYDGPIAIKGLARDATVKITDINGQLVFETEALGGQAIWNGRDYNGRKANTGVYLVFATSRNSSNPDIAVAKILLMN